MSNGSTSPATPTSATPAGGAATESSQSTTSQGQSVSKNSTTLVDGTATQAEAKQPAAEEKPKRLSRAARQAAAESKLAEQGRKAKWGEGKEDPKGDAPTDSATPGQGTPAQDQTGSTAASVATKPSGAEPKEPTTAELRARIRAEREAKQEQTKSKANTEELEKKLSGAAKDAADKHAFLKAVADGDWLGGLRVLGLSDEQIYGGKDAGFFKLGEAIKNLGGQNVDPEQIAAKVQKKLEAEAAAKEEALEKEREAKIEAGYQRALENQSDYIKVCDDWFAGKEKDYPAIVQHKGIHPDAIYNPLYGNPKYKKDDPRAQPGFVQWYIDKHDREPTPKEIADQFEADYIADLKSKAEPLAERLGLTKPAPPPPVPTGVTGDWKASPGTAPAAKPKVPRHQRVEEIARKLNAQAVK